MSLKVKFFIIILIIAIAPIFVVGFMPLQTLMERLLSVGLPMYITTSVIEQMRATVLAYALILAVIVSFVSFLLYRIFAEPISDLIYAMNHAKNSNFNERMPVISSGEIGELSLTFNNMSNTIQKH